MKQNMLIVIPAFNESRNIGPVLDGLRAAVPAADIVVVDDASTDGTRAIVRRLGVPVLALPVNLGYGGAVQTGLRYAVARGYERTVLFDGDGQHDPQDIPALVGALEAGQGDLIIGSRFVGGAKYRMPFARRTGVRLFSLITRLLTGRRVRDITSGFQLMNRPTLELLSREYPADFPDAEVIIMLLRAGFRVAEVPVNIRPRLHGASMYSNWRAVYYPFKVIVAILAVMLRTALVRRTN